MKKCDSINLIAFLEGVDPGGSVKRHISTCAHCRRELDRYRKLIEGLTAAWRPAAQSCARIDRTVQAALGEAAPEPEHLAKCPSCKLVHDAVADGVKQAEQIDEDRLVPLPEKVAQLVAARKKKYLSGHLKKVLDFQGIKDRKKRGDAIRRILADADRALPKAAFPDDLIEKKKKKAKQKPTPKKKPK